MFFLILQFMGRIRSELKSLELEDLGLDGQDTVYEEIALGKQITSSAAERDLLPRSRGEDISLSDETIDRHSGNDQSPVAEDEENALCDETTSRHSGTDQSPMVEECDSDSCDSWVDELDERPSYALPLLMSSSDNRPSEVITDESSMLSYQLPPCTIRGKSKVQYSPDIHAKSKYLMATMC